MTESELLLFGSRRTPTPRVLPRLVTAGQFFALATGERFTAIECSDFNLYGRYLKGENVEPVLEQRADCGFNMRRVWSRYSGNEKFEREIGRLLPSEHPELYDRIPEFSALCASYGAYIEWTAYTGGYREDHWERLGDALEGVPNVLVELINENDAYPHNIRVQEFQPLPGIICSHGSNGSQSWPVRPWWDYETYHTNDSGNEEQRKIGHNAMEFSDGTPDEMKNGVRVKGIPASRVPTLTNETSRYPDVGMWRGQLDDRQQQLAFDSAAGAALLCAGSCFHSQRGKDSTLWDADSLAVAKAWTAGARSVDLACQAGPYTHPASQEGPTDLRVYERPVAGHQCVVTIRK